MKMKKLPVGKSDFKQIIEENYCYVDKTLFIKEVMDKGDTILLIPRPRRFGKTLNLSMLKYFYDCCPETRSPGNRKYKKIGRGIQRQKCLCKRVTPGSASTYPLAPLQVLNPGIYLAF